MLPTDSAVGKEFIPLSHNINSGYSYCFTHIGKKELILTTRREVFMWCTVSTLLSVLCALILSILTPIVWGSYSYLEKAMAPHSSTLAWKIPWTEGPGGLQSKGSLQVRHDWATSFSLFTFMHWRKKWQPTPVFLPGESQGRRSLVGCRLWGRTESDMTEAT